MIVSNGRVTWIDPQGADSAWTTALLARDVDAALTRLRSEGVIVLSYKTLFFELTEAVTGGPHATRMTGAFGEFPDDLPEEAVA